MNKFELALSLLNAGYSVIPVRNKIPVGKWSQYQKQLATEDDLSEWFEVCGHDIGIVTGQLSGITIIDVDPDGLDSDLVKEFDKRNYPCFKTKRGGLHYWFKYSNKIYTQAPIKGFIGIDCRNDGGQAVFYGDRVLTQSELPDFPDTLFPVQEELGTKTDWQEVFKNRGSGRNDVLCSVAGKLISTLPHYEWETVGWPLFRSYDLEYNEPSIIEEWGESDLRKKWDGIASKELQKISTKDDSELQLLSFEHLLTGDVPEIKWLVQDIMPLNGITVVFGDEGAGKTFFYLDLISKVANGNLFLDLFPTKKTRALVIDLESRQDVLQTNLARLGVKNLDLMPYLVCNRNLTFSDYYTDKVIEICKEKGIGLVVIDSLSALISGDNTSSAIAAEVNKQLLKLKFADLSVLLLAHPPKKQHGVGPLERTIQGHNLFSKQLDANWYLENHQDISHLYCHKMRVTKKPDQPIKIYIQGDGKTYYRLTGTEASLAGFATNEQIEHLIKKSLIVGTWNKDDLVSHVVNALNTTRQQVYRVLKYLVDKKLVIMEEEQVNLAS